MQAGAMGIDSGALVRAARLHARSRLVQYPPQRTRAAAALNAAAEAAVDLTRAARQLLAAECNAHVAVAQHVTGTDDHGGKKGPNHWSHMQRSLQGFDAFCNEKRRFYRHSNIARALAWAAPRRRKKGAKPPFQRGFWAPSGCSCRERIDDSVDNLLDQDLVLALAHHPDDRLGSRRPH